MQPWLILTGCNNFGVPGSELRGCINDLRSVWELCRQLYAALGWKVQGHCLVDAVNTADNARAAIADVMLRAAPGDKVWLHNSGHGTKDGNDYYSVAYGFDWRDMNTFVSGSQYYSLLKKGADKGLDILFTDDACNSGAAIGRSIDAPPRDIRAKALANPNYNGNSSVTLGKALAQLDICYMSGSGPLATDYSADVMGPDGKAFGAFTHYLLNSYGKLRQTKATYRQVNQDENAALATDRYEQRPEIHGARADQIMFEGA
jgi:hypothetical protein